MVRICLPIAAGDHIRRTSAGEDSTVIVYDAMDENSSRFVLCHPRLNLVCYRQGDPLMPGTTLSLRPSRRAAPRLPLAVGDRVFLPIHLARALLMYCYSGLFPTSEHIGMPLIVRPATGIARILAFTEDGIIFESGPSDPAAKPFPSHTFFLPTPHEREIVKLADDEDATPRTKELEKLIGFLPGDKVHIRERPDAVATIQAITIPFANPLDMKVCIKGTVGCISFFARNVIPMAATRIKKEAETIQLKMGSKYSKIYWTKDGTSLLGALLIEDNTMLRTELIDESQLVKPVRKFEAADMGDRSSEKRRRLT